MSEVSSLLPLPPVVQHALDDVELLVTSVEGTSSVRRYRPGVAEYLCARYSQPVGASGLRWQITREGEKRE